MNGITAPGSIGHACCCRVLSEDGRRTDRGQMFRKVDLGAPEFRKEGEREKKEKIVESKKKTSTTPVESRSSYSTGIGARRSIFYRKSRIFGA